MIDVAFDEANLIAGAGLVPVVALAERVGLPGLVTDRVRITDAPNSGGANAAAKVMSLLAGMVAGADSITDTDRLRYAAMEVAFRGVRAPSTVGTFHRQVYGRPVVAGIRLRKGRSADVRGAAAMVAEVLATAREAGCTGAIVMRGDSKFYIAEVVAGATRAGAYASLATGSNRASTPRSPPSMRMRGRRSTTRTRSPATPQPLDRGPQRVAGGVGQADVATDGGHANQVQLGCGQRHQQAIASSIPGLQSSTVGRPTPRQLSTMCGGWPLNMKLNINM
ncbi:MAG TPA: hypothetical protein VLJ59_17455 [Mycobacteriales bacterium]|nr:hypothetical protein [Mycobacteriales bacterium]